MIAVIYELNPITLENIILNFIDLFSNWVLTHYYNLQKNEENINREYQQYPSSAELYSENIILRKLLDGRDFFLRVLENFTGITFLTNYLKIPNCIAKLKCFPWNIQKQ